MARTALERVCPVSPTLTSGTFCNHVEAHDRQIHLIPAFFSDPLRDPVLGRIDGLFHVIVPYIPDLGFINVLITEVPSAVERRLAYPPHQRLPERPNRVSCAGHRSSPHQTSAQSHVHGSCLPLVLHGTGQSVGIPPLCLISPCVISTTVQTHGTKMYVIGARPFARRHNLSSGPIAEMTGCLYGDGSTYSLTATLSILYKSFLGTVSFHC